MFTVTVSRGGVVQGVHHNIRARNAAAAIVIARAFYPPKLHGCTFRAEVSA